MKLSSIPGIINEQKIKEDAEKYNLARQLADKYLFDTEYVISIVDMLVSKGVLSNVDKSNSEIWNDNLECYTPHYAMFIWREVTLPTIGIDYKYYQAIDSLKRMKI